MKITIDDNEYEVDQESADIKPILNTLTLGNNAMQLLDHIRNCVSSVQQLKVNELKSTVETTEETIEQE